MPKVKVWRNDHDELFHDECFAEGESRDNYTPVDLNEIDDLESCAACGGPFVFGGADDDDDEDNEDENEQTT